MKKNKKMILAGNALFNGIVFDREDRESITMKDEEGKITVTVHEFEPYDKKSFTDLPFIRAFSSLKAQSENSLFNVSESLKQVSKSLNMNLQVQGITKEEMKWVYLILFLLAILIIIVLPWGISLLFPQKALVEFMIKSVLVISALLMYSLSKKIRPLLRYHGAEHKLINACEKLEEEELTLENVRKMSRFHIRCGTNFLFYFIFLTLLETLLIPSTSIWLKLLFEIIGLVLNISIAYEIVFLLSYIPKPFQYLFYPSLVIQLFTTKKPTDEELKVGLYGIQACIYENLDKKLKEFIIRYKMENKDLVDFEKYTFQEMLQIVSYVTHRSVNDLYIDLNHFVLNYNEQIEITRLWDQLYKEKIPLQYIVQKAYFYHEQYLLSPDVLIPRQDTEVLVEKAIEYIGNYELQDMLDLCTGSGCIGISVAKNTDISHVILSDISKKALEVAKKNIALNQVQSKVETIETDLLNYYIEHEMKFDIIVSNPPYIKSETIQLLDEEVRKEPILALDGGKTGLDFYIRILNDGYKVLKENGYLLLEIGYDQLEPVKEHILRREQYELIEFVKDYSGNDRVVICKVKSC